MLINIFTHNIFKIFDSYLRLILSSWPAVVLILGIFLLFRHRKAIDNFISRIKSASLSGVETHDPNIQEQIAAVETRPEINDPEPVIQTTTTTNEEVEELRRQVGNLSKEKLFEFAYGSIFGSQLQFLLTLKNSGASGLPLNEATTIFLNTSNTYPLLKDRGFPKYVEFLKVFGLVIYQDDFSGNIKITNLGEEFLNYLTINSRTFNKPL